MVLPIRGLESCYRCCGRLLGDEMAMCEPCLKWVATHALSEGDSHAVRRFAFIYGPEDNKPSVTVVCGDSFGQSQREHYTTATEQYVDDHAHRLSGWWACRGRPRIPSSGRISRRLRRSLDLPLHGWMISIHGIVVGIVVEWGAKP